jgi:hydroxymethylpyrimidine/phosphomethylpyrimidine kinase
MTIANVLTIAGTDPSGGAGIQADLKTFSALGAYGMSVVTALVAQNTQGVRAILDVPPDFIAAQIDAVFEDVRVDAVKIGMLSQPAVIEAVAERLRHYRPRWLVLDPVMVAKSGDALLQPAAIGALRDLLLPLASVITPNLPEAGVLLDLEPGQTEAQLVEAAVALRALGPQAVLLKGGHLAAGDAVDILDDGGEPLVLAAPRFETKNTHGTGCTLSAAIAALLAQDVPLRQAVETAKAYITEAIRTSGELSVGHGHGPVHHFHALWRHLAKPPPPGR